jgi:hypothetical protein
MSDPAESLTGLRQIARPRSEAKERFNAETAEHAEIKGEREKNKLTTEDTEITEEKRE